MNKLRLLGLLLPLLVFNFTLPQAVWAKDRDRLPPSPLEITTSDPLLPARTLSALERQDFVLQLDRLNSQAQTALSRGNSKKAFDIWYRELRLRRSLGLSEEVEALGRVGAIAWGENQQQELLVVTRRLQQVQQEAQLSGNIALWQQLGEAYEQLRSPADALSVYEEIIALSRESADQGAIAFTLNKIGQLHLSWFEYSRAAAAYQELLTLAQERENYPSMITLCQQLAYISDRAEEPDRAIEVKSKLLELYLKAEILAKVPALQLSIASDYAATGNFTDAVQSYQAAYNLAISLQQFSDAAFALSRLGQLYTKQENLETALTVYRLLLSVNAKSYNVYGNMKTYAAIGQIYWQRQDYPQALEAFKQGLELAGQLNVRSEYFTEQIEKVNQQM